MRALILRMLGLFVSTLRGRAITRIPLLKWAYYSTYRLLRPKELCPLKLDGFRLLVNPEDKGLASFLITTGVYEPFEVDLMKHLLVEGDCALDIGANVGYYTMIFAKAVGEKGKVISCEPCSDNYRLLKKNLEVNRFENRVTALECAVSNVAGSVKLYKSDSNHGDHRIFPGKDRQGGVAVPSRTIDSLVDPGTPVRLLKIDIQGAELLALQGMGQLMKENEDLHIFMELWPKALQNAGSRPADLVQFLQQHRFTAYSILEGVDCLQSLSSDELLKMADGNREFNLLLHSQKAISPLSNRLAPAGSAR